MPSSASFSRRLRSVSSTMSNWSLISTGVATPTLLDDPCGDLLGRPFEPGGRRDVFRPQQPRRVAVGEAAVVAAAVTVEADADRLGRRDVARLELDAERARAVL